MHVCRVPWGSTAMDQGMPTTPMSVTGDGTVLEVPLIVRQLLTEGAVNLAITAQEVILGLNFCCTFFGVMKKDWLKCDSSHTSATRLLYWCSLLDEPLKMKFRMGYSEQT